MGAAENARGRSPSILLVEDEEHIRQLTADVLDRAGFRVLQAGDAAEASDLWQRYRTSIDVLVADIVIPGKTGAELAVDFRRARPTLKVIFVSGSDRKTLFETEQMVRGAKFLLKPFSARHLIELVRAEIAVEIETAG